MKFYFITTGLLKVNSYFLVDEYTHKAVLIDCGEYLNKIEQVESNYGFKVEWVFLTHAHFDHSGCARKLQKRGAKIYISKPDADKLNAEGSLSSTFNKKYEDLTADYTFCDGERFKFGEIELTAYYTAGHTNGSATFVCGNKIFSGDIMFRHSYGRTDFPTGSDKDMKNSLNFLYNLKDDFSVYPGHGEFTTISDEKELNLAEEL